MQPVFLLTFNICKNTARHCGSKTADTAVQSLTVKKAGTGAESEQMQSVDTPRRTLKGQLFIQRRCGYRSYLNC